MSEFIYNVGEIVLRDDECFWIFPINYFYNFNICSPCFSYMEEKWHIVKTKEASLFRLWRKNISNLSKNEYTVQLSLESKSCAYCRLYYPEFNDKTVDADAEVNSDYGCELKFPTFGRCGKTHEPVTQNGLVKLFFNAEKKENVNVASKINNAELTKENEESSRDAESDDDERNDKKENVSQAKGIYRLFQDFKRLLSNGERSDLTLKVGDREFKVHRNILIVRSPVFASMLQHDTKENATGVVDIPDCSAEAFEVFLSYIYTGSVDTMSSDNIFHLYYAADKYQVNDLKSECVEYMEENLSIQNFCAVMTLSLKHSESALQKKATRFFCDNVKVIIKTVQWQNYVKDYPIQANELYIKAMNA